MSFAEELRTTVSLAVSAIDPPKPCIEVLPTTLLKVSRSAPLPATKVEFVTVPVKEKRSSPSPPLMKLF